MTNNSPQQTSSTVYQNKPAYAAEDVIPYQRGHFPNPICRAASSKDRSAKLQYTIAQIDHLIQYSVRKLQEQSRSHQQSQRQESISPASGSRAQNSAEPDTKAVDSIKSSSRAKAMSVSSNKAQTSAQYAHKLERRAVKSADAVRKVEKTVKKITVKPGKH